MDTYKMRYDLYTPFFRYQRNLFSSALQQTAQQRIASCQLVPDESLYAYRCLSAVQLLCRLDGTGVFHYTPQTQKVMLNFAKIC